MNTTAIICEYNPFHNGHIYHINKIKEMFKEDTIILIMSGNYTQRGEVSLIDKWQKTDIALNYVDLVIELPFVFSVQSADTFAKGAIQIINSLGIKKIVFGTENLDATKLKIIAKAQKTEEFNKLVKKYLDLGNNYPTSLSKASYKLTKIKIEASNDLLGLSYVKAIDDKDIKPITIQRTNNFKDKNLSNTNITSATSIRETLKTSKKKIDKYIPAITKEKLNGHLHFNYQYYDFLKTKIISEIDHLNIYLNVDEGIEGRIKKYIYSSNTLEELIENLKTKRYTYNKISRMLTYIMCGFTKEDAKKYKNIEYIRVLGFNKKGQKFLKEAKKISSIPIISKYENKYKMLELELKTSYIYYSNEKDKVNLTSLEYKHKPVIK